jgi:hypothetical protein
MFAIIGVCLKRYIIAAIDASRLLTPGAARDVTDGAQERT